MDLQHFYNCFKKYMLALLKRHLLQMKRNSKNQAKKLWIAEIVIIKDDKSELWRKGKINRFLESRDGEVRVADLIVFHPKTKNLYDKQSNTTFNIFRGFRQFRGGKWFWKQNWRSAKEDGRRPSDIFSTGNKILC